MTVGILRSLQFVATLTVAGPIAVVGGFNLIEGQYLHGGFFLAAAMGLVVVSEYLYVRLTSRTAERVSRLKNYRPWRRSNDDE